MGWCRRCSSAPSRAKLGLQNSVIRFWPAPRPTRRRTPFASTFFLAAIVPECAVALLSARGRSSSPLAAAASRPSAGIGLAADPGPSRVSVRAEPAARSRERSGLRMMRVGTNALGVSLAAAMVVVLFPGQPPRRGFFVGLVVAEAVATALTRARPPRRGPAPPAPLRVAAAARSFAVRRPLIVFELSATRCSSATAWCSRSSARTGARALHRGLQASRGRWPPCMRAPSTRPWVPMSPNAYEHEAPGSARAASLRVARLHYSSRRP